MSNRDVLGKVVRDTWVIWAKSQPNPKPSWLVPYASLSETDKEADRQIGEAVARFVLGPLNERRLALIERQASIGLVESEAIEYQVLQGVYFKALEGTIEKPTVDADRLDAIERRLEGHEPT